MRNAAQKNHNKESKKNSKAECSQEKEVRGGSQERVDAIKKKNKKKNNNNKRGKGKRVIEWKIKEKKNVMNNQKKEREKKKDDEKCRKGCVWYARENIKRPIMM